MMFRVAEIVARCPGCYMIEPARRVGPNGSLRFGYATVHRAARAGLIEIRYSRGRGRCYPTAIAAILE